MNRGPAEVREWAHRDNSGNEGEHFMSKGKLFSVFKGPDTGEHDLAP